MIRATLPIGTHPHAARNSPVTTENNLQPATASHRASPTPNSSSTRARCEAALQRELTDDSPRPPEVQEIVDALREITAFNKEVLGGRVFPDSTPMFREMCAYPD